MSAGDPNPAFEADPKWKCCCGCHVLLSAKIIGGIHLAFSVLGSLQSVYGLINTQSVDDIKAQQQLNGLGNQDPEVNDDILQMFLNLGVGMTIFQLVLNVLLMVSCALMMHSASTCANPGRMMPFLIVFGFYAVCSCCLIYPASRSKFYNEISVVVACFTKFGVGMWCIVLISTSKPNKLDLLFIIKAIYEN